MWKKLNISYNLQIKDLRYPRVFVYDTNAMDKRLFKVKRLREVFLLSEKQD